MNTRVCVVWGDFKWLQSSGGSRISQTGQGWQPLSLGQKPIIWQDFCRKLHGNEVGPRGPILAMQS